MKASLINFFALFIAVLSLMTGLGLLGTYLPLRLSIMGTPQQVVGLVMSSYYLGMLIGALYCQRLIRQVGHIRTFAAFAALVSAVVMSHGLATDPLFWAVLRFFAGISTIGLYTVIESWLNECTEPHLRGKIMSIYMILSYLGIGIGQLLVNFSDAEGMRVFFMVGLMLTLSIVPVSATRSIHPAMSRFQRFSLVEIFKKAPTGLLGCFVAGLINGAFYSLGPVFCHQAGFNVRDLSLVMSMTVLGGLLLQWPIGILSDRFDRTYVLVCIGFSVTLVGVCIILAASMPFSLFLIAMMLFGGFIFTIYPVSVARAHDLFDTSDIVPVSAALLLAYGIGATIGPVMASSVMSAAETPYGFFVYCSSISALYGAVVFYLRKREIVTIIPAEESTPFVIMKNASPVTVFMDPRTDPQILPDSCEGDADGKH